MTHFLKNKIYQCYFKLDQIESLFTQPCYTGFGLEPKCNNHLFLNCPELEDPKVRLALTEYACFLWFYRNQENLGDWFGTTSYRQLDKTPFIFENEKQIEEALDQYDVVSWFKPLMAAKLYVGETIPISLRMHTGICHPGLNEFLSLILEKFGYILPKEWEDESTGIFANYWVMRKEDFISYMDFSWPMVKYALEIIENSDYFKHQHSYATVTKDKCVGYFMERLYPIWVFLNKKKVNFVVEETVIVHKLGNY